MSTALVLTTRRPVVDHFSKTITVTESFMRAASNVENGECAYLQKLRETCPGYDLVCRKTRKASKAPKKLSYDKMRKYIRCLRDSTRLLELFERVVDYGKALDNGYQVVSEWFASTFPDYGSVPDFDAEGFPIVETCLVSFADLQKKAKVKQPQVEEKEEPAEASLQVVSGL
ncbi:MAG: hypothetical protein IJ466_05880 [Clostridia bacterium]|nr:hypothetical protein [Clostridia bacterium]